MWCCVMLRQQRAELFTACVSWFDSLTIESYLTDLSTPKFVNLERFEKTKPRGLVPETRRFYKLL